MSTDECLTFVVDGLCFVITDREEVVALSLCYVVADREEVLALSLCYVVAGREEVVADGSVTVLCGRCSSRQSRLETEVCGCRKTKRGSREQDEFVGIESDLMDKLQIGCLLFASLQPCISPSENHNVSQCS
ncbi:hypothetical protein L6452_36830 [Arctium lappa]|uniref:Uncharacterized protein n=1 Tax=Arctium lappa TaxID=4217 RepID=A0ACB8Y5G5_ARCLA|nr:hypothetical protein L6452_36830 [Arctium lappa]